MTEHNVEKEIIEIISDVSGFEENEIKPDAHFYEDLEMDSIKAIEITVAIEKKFKIKVRDEDIPNITTVREAVGLANKLLSQNQIEPTVQEFNGKKRIPGI